MLGDRGGVERPRRGASGGGPAGRGGAGTRPRRAARGSRTSPSRAAPRGRARPPGPSRPYAIARPAVLSPAERSVPASWPPTRGSPSTPFAADSNAPWIEPPASSTPWPICASWSTPSWTWTAEDGEHREQDEGEQVGGDRRAQRSRRGWIEAHGARIPERVLRTASGRRWSTSLDPMCAPPAPLPRAAAGAAARGRRRLRAGLARLRAGRRGELLRGRERRLARRRRRRPARRPRCCSSPPESPASPRAGPASCRLWLVGTRGRSPRCAAGRRCSPARSPTRALLGGGWAELAVFCLVAGAPARRDAAARAGGRRARARVAAVGAARRPHPGHGRVPGRSRRRSSAACTTRCPHQGRAPPSA